MEMHGELPRRINLTPLCDERGCRLLQAVRRYPSLSGSSSASINRSLGAVSGVARPVSWWLTLAPSLAQRPMTMAKSHEGNLPASKACPSHLRGTTKGRQRSSDNRPHGVLPL
jgi:hypothetical protein